MDWSCYEKGRRYVDKNNFGVDPKRKDGPTKRSVGNESDLSSTSSATHLDHGSEITNRMEVMPRLAQQATTGHPSI
ncbi:hypothetical protein Y032_0056g2709 [Ancylostoma ceylanicum]|uniref:Uncharacterized protein n=1 Tax=Ancylostoma ceylanicum TaxID=53326 RepID=A0A016U4Y2_9BILA|nr:hypothetical protein Y032_0056g2709 [Ancylostoma ceylanicum]